MFLPRCGDDFRSMINRAKGKLIAASRDKKKPDYEVRGVPTSPRCALHSTILLV